MVQSMIEYREHRFAKLKSARKKQASIRKRFGYEPSIFRMGKKEAYVIVEPVDLKPLKKKGGLF